MDYCVDMYRQVTRNIAISVRPVYLEDQSSPCDNHYVWAYHIRIENGGAESVQLLNRYWRITDAQGRVQEVRGPGVVGKQPTLDPGDSFEYSSGTPLGSPSGIMVGTYEMETNKGVRFNAEIPAFSLDSPHQPISLN
jgi:ApaG protein